MKIAPSDGSYRTFCDIMTGYRLASVVTKAVNSGVIERVGSAGVSEASIIAAAGFKPEEGRRFLALLVNAGVLGRYDDLLYLSQFARKYLHSESELNQLNVLEFEQSLIDRWNGLDAVLRDGQGNGVAEQSDATYQQRLTLFQKAMHEAALVRSNELWEAFGDLPGTGVIIDIGAGDGTYLKEFLKRFPQWQAIACDLADVLAVNAANFAGAAITAHACNLLDPLELEELVSSYRGSADIMLLSNVIHCYSKEENAAILGRLREIVRPAGLLVIHDFFTDGNSFGALYDLHMMVNTYNGRTYSFNDNVRMLGEEGFNHADVIELPSYSHAIIATRQPRNVVQTDVLFPLRQKARALGFYEAAALDPAGIRIEPWVKAKCRYGCACYGKKWSCPPNSMGGDEFRELLGCYSKALLVAGQAPLHAFQENLLELEKAAFLTGSKKALVFSGGPCTWCDSCDDDRCRFPEKRRSSLESCGCDVFALAEQCNIQVKPLKNREDFVQYVGLLLVE